MLLPFGLKQKSDGGAQIGQALLFRLPLPVRSGDLKTGGPETAFLRLTRVHYGRERGHTVKLVLTCNDKRYLADREHVANCFSYYV